MNRLHNKMIGFVLGILLCIAISVYSIRHVIMLKDCNAGVLCITTMSAFFSLSVLIVGPIESNTGFQLANYWISFLLSWFIIPMLIEFRDAADPYLLLRLQKTYRSFISLNAWSIAITLICMIVVMLSEGLTVNTMTQIITSLSNIFGLIIIIPALGIGLVGLPRSLYIRTDRHAELSLIHTYIGMCKDKIIKTTTELQKLKDKIDGISEPVPYPEYITGMLGMLPPTLHDSPEVNISTTWYGELVNIKTQIIAYMRDYDTYNYWMHTYIRKVLKLKVESPWNISVRPLLHVVLFVGSILLSAIVCWSEVTLPAQVTMLTGSAPLSILIMLYMTACIYHTYRQMCLKQDPLYSSMLLNRFIISVPLNYMYIIGNENTVYYKDSSPCYVWLATYYPVLTLVFALGAALNIKKFCEKKLEQYVGYQILNDGSDVETGSDVEAEGVRLVDNEQRYMTESVI